MTPFIALLRGVNVGGAGKLPMAELRAFCEELGLTAPQTLLQSGNLVFRHQGRSTAELEDLLQAKAAARLNVKTTFHVRTPAEWNRLIEANPFPDMARDAPARLLLLVLKDDPDPDAVAAVQALIEGPEKIVAGERALYVSFADGQGNSKAAPLIDRKLSKTGTGRNWNTVLKLQAMVAD